MEVICSAYLIREKYEVDIEHPLNKNLLCDIYGVKGEGSFIIEVETGFIPPENAIDPQLYWKARIASKIARYSNYSNRFALASPPTTLLPIPKVFLKPPRYRKKEEVEEIKELCDFYYSNPPVSFEEILNARIHHIFIINVDKGNMKLLTPEDYLNLLKNYFEKIDA